MLVDSRAVVERTWQRWAERHGIDPAPFLEIAHGRRARDTLQAINPALARDEEVDWLDAAELVDLPKAIDWVRGDSASIPAPAWSSRMLLQALQLRMPLVAESLGSPRRIQPRS